MTSFRIISHTSGRPQVMFLNPSLYSVHSLGGFILYKYNKNSAFKRIRPDFGPFFRTKGVLASGRPGFGPFFRTKAVLASGRPGFGPFFRTGEACQKLLLYLQAIQKDSE